MKKRVMQTLAIAVILLILVIGSMTTPENQNTIVMYEGKWKVTGLLAECYRNKTTFFPQHYLGRTVILGETSIEVSIFEWPYDLGWRKEEYDSAEVVWLSKDDTWVWVNYSWEINKLTESEEIQFIRYLNEGIDGDVYCTADFIVLDNTHLVGTLIGGYYLLEPYQYCDAEVNSSAIYGSWEIAYLDSYENSYEGGFEEIELQKWGSAMREKMSALKGTDFAAEEWLGKTVHISENTLELSETSFQIKGVEEGRVLREDFENEMGIHDGLSIYDDEIKVCNIRCSNDKDIICVLVDTNKVIMHIGQGWFVLTRKQ